MAVRIGAASEALASKPPPADIRVELSSLYRDPDEKTRRIAVLALGRIGPDALGDIERFLDAAQPAGVRAAACQAAGALGPAAGRLAHAVAGCLAATEDRLRGAAWIALWRIGAASVPYLVQVLQSSNERGPLVAAANAAGAIGREARAAEDALRRGSAHSDPHVALACADALGRVAGCPAAALPGLVGATRAEDPGLRAEAVRRIGALQREGLDAENALSERAADPVPAVRAAAVLALALVGAPAQGLRETTDRLLEDAESEVRSAAAAAAAYAKESGRPLLPHLRRLGTHADRRTAVAARKACDVLEGNAVPIPKRPPPGDPRGVRG